MSDVGSFLFGGTQKAPKPRVDQASTLTSDQLATLNQLNQLIRQNLGSGVSGYTGQLTAPQSSLQSQSFAGLSDLLKQGQPTSSNQAIEQILAGTKNVPGAVPVKGYDVGQFDPTAIQNWYQNALVTPAMTNWQQNIVPQIQEKFIGQNAGSSGGANRAIAASAANVMQGLNSDLANALMGEKQAFDTRQFTAGMDTANKEYQSATDYVNRLFGAGQNDLNRIQAVPGMQSTSTTDWINSLMQGVNAGGVQRDIGQQGLTNDYQQWLATQPYNNPWLQFLGNAVGTPAFENVVQPAMQQQGLIQTMMPMLSSWAGSGFKT